MPKMRVLFLAPLLLSACTREAIPQYMQDAPRTSLEANRIIEAIEEELGEEFTVTQQDKIFFIASNASPRLTERCKGTVRGMYNFLYKDYLKKKPTSPLRVYLFKDRKSYDAYCERAYDSPPSTPFGFYMSHERKMVMNIATGTGTLAHEMVHPLLAEDFPRVPSWFNEGFASLYEQSRTVSGGSMEGLLNWRLPGLQNAISENRSVTLAELMKTSTGEFYGDERGVHYAAARYLCLYLQEKGLLQDFYKAFKGGFKEDRTGIEALEKVTDLPLKKFEAKWTSWVKSLRYRR